MRDVYCSSCACEALNTAEGSGCPAAQARLQAYLLNMAGGTFDASTSSGAFIPQSVDLNGMSVARENTDAMNELAHETGGLFFENNNDLLKGIQRAFADGREYYVIAYVPKNNSEDGTFRRIAVEVNNKKLHVNAKAGYWAVKR